MAPIRHRSEAILKLGVFLSAGWVSCALAPLPGCATNSGDLERAQRHYDAHEFARALAVLRLLGVDEGALGEREQVRYAYLRGMTDYRLSSLTKADDRSTFLSCARDWLTVALEGSTQHPSALSDDERSRARGALEALGGRSPAERACLTGE